MTPQRSVFAAALLASVVLAGCSIKPPDPPYTAEAPPEPKETLVWVGRGSSFERAGDGWKRTPENDYEFTVVQRREARRWESMKTVVRRHPDYGGVAGPRAQALWFRVDLGEEQGERVRLRVTSTLGDGDGTTDRDLRTTTVLVRAKGVPGFFPFDHYRISQELRPDEGRLVERVELLKVGKDGAEKLFSKIEEEARLFRPVM